MPDHDAITSPDAEPPAPARVRVPLEMAITWVCPCGFRVGIPAGPEADRIVMAVATGVGAEKPCPNCGVINELYEKPPEQQLTVVRGGAPAGARNHAERRATAAQLRYQLGGLVGPDGKLKK